MAECEENITPTKTVEKQCSQDRVSAEEDNSFDPDSPNQKFFNLKDVKPLDLKGKWLGNTHQVISKFDQKMSELTKEKKLMKEGFREFAENQHRFRISSLRKINFHFDKKALYLEFMQKSRRTIEKLHPSLILNIYSYIEANVFFAMAKVRRVSQIFNFIYKNQQICKLFSQKDFGVPYIPLSVQERWCKKFVDFSQTFIYYKAINYTSLLPQNSIKEDLEKAVNFINETYKKVFEVKSKEIGYFQLVNKFMKAHRVAIALESLSFADLAVTRRASIIAFSNYLAFNPTSRLKQEITKTKYLKMIQLVDGEDCQDALVVNSRISNFLIEQYAYEFAVFVDTLKAPPAINLADEPVFDLVVFHYHNSLKSFFAKGIFLQNGRIEVSGVILELSQDLKVCRLSYSLGERWQTEILNYHYMPSVGKLSKFGHSYIYRSQFYYILVIKTEPFPQQA